MPPGIIVPNRKNAICQFWSNRAKEFDSISEPGTYQFIASATEGSGLYGRSNSGNIDAIDPADISNYHFYNCPSIGDENSIDLRVYYIDSEDTPQQLSLDPSSEFDITKVIDENGKNVGLSIPSKPGEYTFTFKGKGYIPERLPWMNLDSAI